MDSKNQKQVLAPAPTPRGDTGNAISFYRLPKQLVRSNWPGIKSLAELKLFLQMAVYADGPSGLCYASLATLAKATGFNQTTVSRAILGLLKSGYIAVDKEGTRTSPTVYRITLNSVLAVDIGTGVHACTCDDGQPPATGSGTGTGTCTGVDALKAPVQLCTGTHALVKRLIKETAAAAVEPPSAGGPPGGPDSAAAAPFLPSDNGLVDDATLWKFAGEHGRPKVEAAYAALKRKRGALNNPAGLLRTMLANGFTPPTASPITERSGMQRAGDDADHMRIQRNMRESLIRAQALPPEEHRAALADFIAIVRRRKSSNCPAVVSQATQSVSREPG